MALEEQNIASDEGSGRVAEMVDLKLLEDPDSGLELREDFSEELQASLEAVARGDATKSAEQIAKKLGLPW